MTRRMTALLGATLVLGACTSNHPFRDQARLCTEGDCTRASLEQHAVEGAPGTSYLLGVVEFDDHGAKLVPAQMTALLGRLAAESAEQDLCLVVYVHGWKHNAAADDPDIVAFGELLAQLARTEGQHAPGAWNKPRKVAGIYAGWRGQSLNAGDLAAELTFWNRKDAATRVAQGSIRELLGRMRALRDGIDRTTWSGTRLPPETPPPPGERLRSTRLMVIGHSFGGLIVYTALAQYFTDRAAAAATADLLGRPSEAERAITPYGDLVVLINPAVEAMSFEPIRQIVQDRPAGGYAREQKPVLVEVTSDADQATGTAYPLGRSFDTAFDDFIDDEERRASRQAVGHYAPFWTHDLAAAADAPPAEAAPTLAAKALTGALAREECEAHRAFDAQWRSDGHLRSGWTRRYSAGAVLTHRAQSRFAADDPFWIVRTDASMIDGHSDIRRPIFVDFVRQLYDELLLDDRPC